MADITLYTRNIFETGTVTVTGTADTGYPKERLYDRNIDLYWKETVTEAKNFTVDQGATGNLAIDFLAIDKHNFNGEDMEWQWSAAAFGAGTDAVTDWTQGDNLQIIKTLTAALTKRYWRVKLTSMANPKCSEIYMSYGYDFSLKLNPTPLKEEMSNVIWRRSVGGLERSTKFGDARRRRTYSFRLDSTGLTNFEAAMGDLDEYSKPFYICDHDGDYWLCRLVGDPSVSLFESSYSDITINIIEIL